MRFAIGMVFLAGAALQSPAATGQTRSPAMQREAKAFLMSCSDYKGDGKDECLLGQNEFVENYADAMAGRLDSWRNLGYFFNGQESKPRKYGIAINQTVSCSWRLAVLFSADQDVWSTDPDQAHLACQMLKPADFEAAKSRARAIVRRIKIIDEDSPKAPWAQPDIKIDPKCLDSTVVPFSATSAPTAPAFVPPPGCPGAPKRR